MQPKLPLDILLVHDVAEEQDWLDHNKDCKMNSG